MKKEEVFKTIKEKVGEKLNDEQINELIGTWNFEQYDAVPKIVITDDPYEFERKTRQEEFEDYQYNNGTAWTTINTEVLLGDYAPGIDISNLSGSYEKILKHEMADFSLNEPQVAVVTHEYIDKTYDNDTEKYDETIYVYAPDKVRFSDKLSYKNMVFDSRRKELFDKLKESVGEKLTDAQLKSIVQGFEIEADEELPKIFITNDPIKFESETREDDSSMNNGSTLTSTNTLLGDYEPGIDGNYIKEEEHKKGNFSINQLQVAYSSMEYHDNLEDYGTDGIYIYIPEEKDYPQDVSFQSLLVSKSKLAQKETELSRLESEAQTLSEAEQLIERKNNEHDRGE